jgi:hypothetical protein
VSHGIYSAQTVEKMSRNDFAKIGLPLKPLTSVLENKPRASAPTLAGKNPRCLQRAPKNVFVKSLLKQATELFGAWHFSGCSFAALLTDRTPFGMHAALVWTHLTRCRRARRKRSVYEKKSRTAKRAERAKPSLWTKGELPPTLYVGRRRSTVTFTAARRASRSADKQLCKLAARKRRAH